MNLRNSLLLCLALHAACALAADPPASTPAPAAAPADPSKAAGNVTPPASGAPAQPAAPAAASPDPAAATGTPPPGTSAREAELAAVVPQRALDDELVWLNAADGRFFAFRRSPVKAEPPKGALLLVPGPRAFIDQRPMTTQLREAPRHGGVLTFAIQVPLAEPESTPAMPEPAAAPPADPAATPPAAATPTVPPDALCGRLTAALAMLEATRPPYIAVAAEDDSADRVLACYPDGLPPTIKAFAAIGRWRGKLEGIKVPSIEFVPLLDRAAMREADRRAAVVRKPGAPVHRRVDIEAADQRFKGAELEVAKRLRGWLEKMPAPAPLPPGVAPAPPVSG